VPDSLHRLLDLQDHDLHIDQLRHRRATLPERAALADQERALVSVDAERAAVAEPLGALERSQKRLEDEIASLGEKQAAENAKLYSGTVTSPRELQAMQEEIDTLARRQRALEDEVLDVMEQAEPLLERAGSLDEERARIEGALAGIQAALADGEAAVDAELAEAGVQREALAGHLSEALLATYEKLRARLGGVAVARLEGSQCLGCHLSLPATEVDAIRHAAPDAVLTHEECGRILVR
jgi:predicted  nucleic acid-binding Zn-ribbon protein